MGRRATRGCGPVWGRRGSGQGAQGVQQRGTRGRPSWWAPDPASQTCLPIFGEWCSPGRRAKCATAALTPAARLLTSGSRAAAHAGRAHPALPAARARGGGCRGAELLATHRQSFRSEKCCVSAKLALLGEAGGRQRRRRARRAAPAEAAESVHPASSQEGEVVGRAVPLLRGPAWAPQGSSGTEGKVVYWT